MSALNSPHVFTDQQLSQYLQLLFGSSHELSSLPALQKGIASDPLTTIGILQTQHLAAVPFSTVGFNYEPAKIPIASLDPQDVFEKVVVKKQGGFCLEMNIFFSAVLRSLGVENYLAGGRISYVVGNTVATIKRDPKGFDGW
jgi:arylamine N-acetyltransferase